LFDSGEMEPLMLKLSEGRLERGFLARANEQLDIPILTLRSWRKQLKADSTYRPYRTPPQLLKACADSGTGRAGMSAAAGRVPQTRPVLSSSGAAIPGCTRVSTRVARGGPG
jgi:hypothetical protein